MSVYRESLPMGMPRPPAPWSPMPRMRSPSVTTMTSTSGLGRFRSSVGIESRSGYGDEQAAGPAVDVAELLARLRDHRRVDHGRHLLDVVEEEPVEEDLVGVLQGAQVDVPLEVVVLAPVGLVRADHLLVQALDLRRQEAVQAEPDPLVLRERRAPCSGPGG